MQKYIEVGQSEILHEHFGVQCGSGAVLSNGRCDERNKILCNRKLFHVLTIVIVDAHFSFFVSSIQSQLIQTHEATDQEGAPSTVSSTHTSRPRTSRKASIVSFKVTEDSWDRMNSIKRG